MADGGGTAWPGTPVLSGSWSGTARSTTGASLTFPVSATVAVARGGRPTGSVVLGTPVGCSGSWTPVSVNRGVTSFRESITTAHGAECVDDGIVRLSAASGGRLRYVWAKGDLGSVGYLEPTGLSGTWTGTIVQGPDRMRATVRVNGTRVGQAPGATSYAAPLACGGVLTPIGPATPTSARFTEIITRSSSAICVGVGTTTLRLRSGGRLSYRWEGGGEVSTGVLRRRG